ncbi:sensor histidine kinase [Sulfurospirillum sp. 1307]
MKKFLQYIHSFSIYTKLAFLIFGVIFIFSSTVVFLTIETAKNQTNEIISEMIQSNINSNKDFLADAILARDNWALFKFVKSLSKNSVVSDAGIIDTNNIVLAHTDTKTHKVGTILDDKQNHTITEFRKDGVLLGYFVLDIEKKSIKNILEKNFSNNFLFMTLAALVSFLIAIFFMKNLLDRLDILVYNAKAISLKKWDDIKEIKSVENDEITILIITITELMKEMKRVTEQEKITHSLQSVGEISSLFAHEIKNLLQPLKLLLEEDDELTNEDMKIIHTTLNRMDAQVVDFLSLGKPLDIQENETLHVKDIMNEICSIVKPRADEKNIEIISKIDDMKINISKNSIEMILMNLISNSIEVLDDGGKISIDWQKQKNGMSLLKIQDSGPGIPSEIKEKIFKPFFTTKKNGSGLGLFTVYKIVYLSGGHMHLGVEEKTTFRVYLPVIKE